MQNIIVKGKYFQACALLPLVPVLVGAEKLNAGAAVVVVVPNPPKAPNKQSLQVRLMACCERQLCVT